VINNLFYWM